MENMSALCSSLGGSSGELGAKLLSQTVVAFFSSCFQEKIKHPRLRLELESSALLTASRRTAATTPEDFCPATVRERRAVGLQSLRRTRRLDRLVVWA